MATAARYRESVTREDEYVFSYFRISAPSAGSYGFWSRNASIVARSCARLVGYRSSISCAALSSVARVTASLRADTTPPATAAARARGSSSSASVATCTRVAASKSRSSRFGKKWKLRALGDKPCFANTSRFRRRRGSFLPTRGATSTHSSGLNRGTNPYCRNAYWLGFSP